MFDARAQNQYDRDGYCRLPGLIPPSILARLRALIDRLLVVDTVPGKVVLETPVGRVISNVDNLMGWAIRSSSNSTRCPA